MKQIAKIFYLIIFQFQIADCQIFEGGSGDGNASVEIIKTDLHIPTFVFEGRIGDGSTNESLSKVALNLQTPVFAGGNGDGASYQLIPSMPLYLNSLAFQGGTSDGASQLYLVKINLRNPGENIFVGGSGKGQDALFSKYWQLDLCNNFFTWNGSQDQSWTNPLNWGCSLVPISTSIVSVPTEIDNYPQIISSQSIKQLNMSINSFLTISQPNGRLNIIGPQ